MTNPNQLNEEQEISSIIFKFFDKTEDGRRLLKVMKSMFLDNVNLPASLDHINSYGGADVYLGYCEGKKSVYRWICDRIKSAKNINTKPQRDY